MLNTMLFSEWRLDSTHPLLPPSLACSFFPSEECEAGEHSMFISFGAYLTQFSFAGLHMDHSMDPVHTMLAR